MADFIKSALLLASDVVQNVLGFVKNVVFTVVADCWN